MKIRLLGRKLKIFGSNGLKMRMPGKMSMGPFGKNGKNRLRNGLRNWMNSFKKNKMKVLIRMSKKNGGTIWKKNFTIVLTGMSWKNGSKI